MVNSKHKVLKVWMVKRVLKYYDYAVTFSEFPDEIALCVNITNCPGHCKQCSEPWLLSNVGTELTNQEIDKMIIGHPDCTVFGMMGGDSDHLDVIRIASYIKNKYNIKIGLYSGVDYIDVDLIPYVDYYKIGRWIAPEGPAEEWNKMNCGPLRFTFSNQLFFEKKDNKLVNATYKFRKQPINNLSQYIIK